MNKKMATVKNTIGECDHEVFYRYDSPMTMVEAVEFLHAIDADDAPPTGPKRPNPAISRQKMPAVVSGCAKNCGQTRPLERDGGIRQLLAIGWLGAGEMCILHVGGVCSTIGVIDANGMLRPYDKQHMVFANPAQWLAHEGIECDATTSGYRFVLIPALKNASLYQLAAIYAHSSKCVGARYTHAKTARLEDSNMLSRHELEVMLASEGVLNAGHGSMVERELNQEIERLQTKLAAYHKFFMALQIE